MEEIERVKALWDRNQDILTQCLMLPEDPEDAATDGWEIPGNELFDSGWLEDLEQMYLDAAAGRGPRESYRRGRHVLQKIENREEILMRLARPSERVKRKAPPAKRVTAFIANLLYMIGNEAGT
jgi:hypothetical protein